MIRCIVCNEHAFVISTTGQSHFCTNTKCGLYKPFKNETKKARLVIEIKAGALAAAFCDTDIELILVDHDEIEGGISSAVIIPDNLSEMPAETKRLAEDAVRRS